MYVIWWVCLALSQVVCPLVYADSLDFVTKVHNDIVLEISSRLEISPKDVTIHQLGIRNIDQCRDATSVRIDIPQQEDFRGKTLVVIEGWESEQQCGRWTVQANIEIWSMLPINEYAVEAGESVQVSWKRGRLDQVRMPLFIPSDPSLQHQWVGMVPLQNHKC